jgi:thiamine-phosphate pyrophosphorylase
MLLYYITGRKAFPGTDAQQREGLLRKVADCARAGVDYIQLREKDLSARELEHLAIEVLQAIRESAAASRLLINSRTDIALACGADGVHLAGGELAPSEVRTIWMRCCNRQPLIGVSAHSSADVRCAQVQTADFVVLAPIFEKAQTGMRGIGLEALRDACAGAQLHGNAPSPDRFCVLALGGVTLSNARSCVAAGTAGVAGIRLFQQGDVFETVRRLRQL